MSVAAQSSSAKSVRTGRTAEVSGRSHPLGATLVADGANFSVFSRKPPAWNWYSSTEPMMDGRRA